MSTLLEEDFAGGDPADDRMASTTRQPRALKAYLAHRAFV
jgi:hypothetical protein